MSRDTFWRWLRRLWWAYVGWFLFRDLWTAYWSPHPVRSLVGLVLSWALPWAAILVVLFVFPWFVVWGSMRYHSQRLHLPPPPLREVWAEYVALLERYSSRGDG